MIPEGHNGVYFDLKKRDIKTGEELQKLIDSISDEQLTRIREDVVKYREDVLRFAGTRVFAKAVENAIVVAKASKKSLELV